MRNQEIGRMIEKSSGNNNKKSKQNNNNNNNNKDPISNYKTEVPKEEVNLENQIEETVGNKIRNNIEILINLEMTMIMKDNRELINIILESLKISGDLKIEVHQM